MENGNNMPVKKFQAAGVCAAVWRNVAKNKTGQLVEHLSVSVDRTYKDSKGNWQHTGSLKANDIPKAIVALSEAYKYMIGGQNGEQDKNEG